MPNTKAKTQTKRKSTKTGKRKPKHRFNDRLHELVLRQEDRVERGLTPIRRPTSSTQKTLDYAKAYGAGSRSLEVIAASLVPRRGKRLTAEAVESLRYMANHMLEFAAAIEFIINNGRTQNEVPDELKRRPGK